MKSLGLAVAQDVFRTRGVVEEVIMLSYLTSRVDALLAAVRMLRRDRAPTMQDLGEGERGVRAIEGFEPGGALDKGDATGNDPGETLGRSTDMLLIAYRVNLWPRMRLVAASSARPWMLATNEQFANRCLPMLIANQAGWCLLNSHSLRVTWSGSNDIGSVQIEYLRGLPPHPAVSHFGHGIVTWNIPYLFRTPRGYNLLVRGPSNSPKDGAYPLEGIVESDWSSATFTMNWKLTRPGHAVMFDVEEPICMLVPQRRGELESFCPIIRSVHADAKVHASYKQWSQNRAHFLTELKRPDSEAVRQRWQKHYFRGMSPDGAHTPGHQTKLILRDFEEHS